MTRIKKPIYYTMIARPTVRAEVPVIRDGWAVLFIRHQKPVVIAESELARDWQPIYHVQRVNKAVN